MRWSAVVRLGCGEYQTRTRRTRAEAVNDAQSSPHLQVFWRKLEGRTRSHLCSEIVIFVSCSSLLVATNSPSCGCRCLLAPYVTPSDGLGSGINRPAQWLLDLWGFSMVVLLSSRVTSSFWAMVCVGAPLCHRSLCSSNAVVSR
jgi:hypothetical protein